MKLPLNKSARTISFPKRKQKEKKQRRSRNTEQ